MNDSYNVKLNSWVTTTSVVAAVLGILIELTKTDTGKFTKISGSFNHQFFGFT